jgi:hypothetical protein
MWETHEQDVNPIRAEAAGNKANNGDRGALSKMKPSRWIGSLNLHVTLLALLVGAGAVLSSAGLAAAQEAAPEEAAAAPEAELLSAEEIRELVAPVALYPDELLAVVLPATTNPLQIVQAQRYLDKRQTDQSLKPDQAWDPSILALLNYPDVVAKMNDDLEWTENLGTAVIDQQADVMDAIQQIRAEANAAGYLQTNEKQVVVQEKETIVIQSADPEVVYVPTYDPQAVVVQNYAAYPPPVYSNPYPYYYSPAATFFAGAVVGAPSPMPSTGTTTTSTSIPAATAAAIPTSTPATSISAAATPPTTPTMPPTGSPLSRILPAGQPSTLAT